MTVPAQPPGAPVELAYGMNPREVLHDLHERCYTAHRFLMGTADRLDQQALARGARGTPHDHDESRRLRVDATRVRAKASGVELVLDYFRAYPQTPTNPFEVES